VANSEQGNIDLEEDDFNWGFTFADTDDNEQVVAAVSATSAQVSADLGPLLVKLDTILSLIPSEGIASADHTHEHSHAPHTHPEYDFSAIEAKIDSLIAEDEKILDGLANHEHPHEHPHEHEPVDFSEVIDKLDGMELLLSEVRELDFNNDGSVDFGDINNNLADLLTRQSAVEEELDAKKVEFEEFKTKKLKSIERLILPLLKNLKSNPNKAYIHWPNRSAIIDAQISKILSITR
jgi:hypothetical protein